jgi:hypothetical protein
MTAGGCCVFYLLRSLSHAASPPHYLFLFNSNGTFRIPDQWFAQNNRHAMVTSVMRRQDGRCLAIQQVCILSNHLHDTEPSLSSWWLLIPCFYGNRRFITESTRVHQRALPWHNPIHTFIPRISKLLFNITLPSSLSLLFTPCLLHIVPISVFLI